MKKKASESDPSPIQEQPNTPTTPSELGFNVEEFLVPQDAVLAVPVQRLITTLTVKRPSKQLFFRVQPDWPLDKQFYTLTVEASGETFLLLPDVAPHAVDAKTRHSALCITRDGAPFLWLFSPRVDASGRANAWGHSAYEASKAAKDRWVQIRANMTLGHYEALFPENEYPDPTWPELTFQQAINLAFDGRVIGDPKHEVLQMIRGER